MKSKNQDEIRLVQVIERISGELLSLKLREFKKVDSLELSLSHFQYIEAIHSLGSPTFSALATHLQISRPAVTAFIAKLILQDLVEKVQSSEDRRSFTIHLTGRGKKLANAYEKALLGFAGVTRKRLLDHEFSNLIHLLEKAFPGITGGEIS